MKIIYIFTAIIITVFSNNSLAKKLPNNLKPCHSYHNILKKDVVDSKCILTELRENQSSDETIHWKLQRCTNSENVNYCFERILTSFLNPKDNWKYTNRINPVNDQTINAISTQAYSSFTGENTLQIGGSLIIGCFNGILTASVYFPDIVNNIEDEAIVRIGKEKARNITFKSTNSSESYLFHEKPEAFIKEIVQSPIEHLIVQGRYPFISNSHLTVTVMFNTDGISEAIKPIIQSCPIEGLEYVGTSN